MTTPNICGAKRHRIINKSKSSDGVLVSNGSLEDSAGKKVYLTIAIYAYLSIHPSILPSVRPSVHPSIRTSDPFIDTSIRPSVRLSVRLFIHLFTFITPSIRDPHPLSYPFSWFVHYIHSDVQAFHLQFH